MALAIAVYLGTDERRPDLHVYRVEPVSTQPSGWTTYRTKQPPKDPPCGDYHIIDVQKDGRCRVLSLVDLKEKT